MRHTLTDRNAENKILTCRNPAVTRKFNLLRYNKLKHRTEVCPEFCEIVIRYT